MSINQFLKSSLRNLQMVPGWRTKRKLIVIESDDWGCWRIRDKRGNKSILEKLPNLSVDPYFQYDSLETPDDLCALFNELSSIKDVNGNSPIITANTIVANPDFEKIRENNFQEYFYKTYINDLDGEVDRTKLPILIKQGIESDLYRPQLHGREHLNVKSWMKALEEKNNEVLAAFDLKYFGINFSHKTNGRRNFMAAFNYLNISEIENHIQILSDSQKIFTEIFGFKSRTFIAPAYYWDTKHEDGLYKEGVRGIQGLPFQLIPHSGKSSFKKRFRYTKNRHSEGMTQLIRNVFFEPSQLSDNDIVSLCLSRISDAFRYGKPAIISSHRVNFMGYMLESNRSNNLNKLTELLTKAIKLWPEIEFISSDVLVDIINDN